MKKTFLLVCVVAFGIWFWSEFFPSARVRLVRLVHSAAQLVSFEQSEHPFERLARGKKIGALLSDAVKIEIHGTRFDKNKELTKDQALERLIAARASVPYLRVDVREVDVSIRGIAAEVHFSVFVDSVDPRTSGPYRELYDFLATILREKDGRWRFKTLHHVAKDASLE